MEVPHEGPPGGPTSAAISNAVVRVFRERLGKGPTKAKTYLNDDLISCVLRGGFSRQEATLVGAGRSDLVEEARHAIQKVIAAELIAVVEELTGRTVEVFLSANHVDPDVSLETFILAPLPKEDEPAEAGPAATDA